MLMTRFVVVKLIADLHKSARGISRVTLIFHPSCSIALSVLQIYRVIHCFSTVDVKCSIFSS